MTQHGGERGITIGGNANVSGQVASGDNVTQTQHQGGAAGSAALAELTRVERLLDEHADQIPEVGRARRDLADVREELEGDDADTERVEGALGRLGRRVAGVTVLVEAVKNLAGQLGLN
ncbi:hypothetical protein [Actinomadura hibisca]|uniref:hypothetical protein n=1 Tax=Actinomadura hibisca TaxID=68565 RepID=UPI000831F420|nr:hypothetical protein [Actinomadura hibisca]